MTILSDFGAATFTDGTIPQPEKARRMKRNHSMPNALVAVAAAVIATGAGITTATATDPCGDFGECKALIEINSSDGDIGFHFLMDGSDLNSARIHCPNGAKIFEDFARGPLRDQKLTETFAESAEPPCFDPLTDSDPDNDDEDFVTLEDFIDRWAAGTYVFTGSGDGGEKSEGETVLTYDLPAAPMNLAFNSSTGVVSWDPGHDLGKCATAGELDNLVADGSTRKMYRWLPGKPCWPPMSRMATRRES